MARGSPFFIGFWRRIYRELAEAHADKHGISKTFIWINEMRLCGQTEMPVWINVARSSGWTGMFERINEIEELHAAKECLRDLFRGSAFFYVI